MSVIDLVKNKVVLKVLNFAQVITSSYKSFNRELKLVISKRFELVEIKYKPAK